MPALLETLAAQLERPRVVPDQVVHHLGETYGVDRDAIGPFLVQESPGWEDYQVDLALSPIFTPSLLEQGLFAELLGTASVPATEWPGLVTALVQRPVVARLTTADGNTHSLPLGAVTIERFVHRLRLEGTIPPSIFAVLEGITYTSERAILKAIARRAIWESEPRRAILEHALVLTREATSLNDLMALLRLMEAHQPRDATDLLARIPQWQQVLRQQIDAATGPKPFFNERVEELHGGGRDQRGPMAGRVKTKTDEHAFLERLRQIFEATAQ